MLWEDKNMLKSLIIAELIILLYIFLMCTTIEPIRNLRTIYVETAMSTMTKRWLATSFMPKYVVDKVVKEQYEKKIEMAAEIERLNKQKLEIQRKKQEEDALKRFYSEFEYINKSDIDNLMKKHPEFKQNGYRDICLDWSGDITKSELKTKYGDPVITIDGNKGVALVQVSGQGYVGKMAIVDGRTKVELANSEKVKSGEILRDIANRNNALVAINASGFCDPGGVGNGGTPVGLVMADGKVLNNYVIPEFSIVGFDTDGVLRVCTQGELNRDIVLSDAVQFSPALIVSGVKMVTGSDGWGVQPRTAIGQTKDGTTLMLTIDGRQLGYSIGATVGECANIMERYGAVNACCLDGGSSTVMVYRGTEITKPANRIATGRALPNAFIVR